jgi:signal transduction histidine kinase
VKYADIVFNEDLQRVFNEVQDYSESGYSEFEQEYRIKKKNGEVIWIYDFTSIIKDENGSITHYYGYILDITKHKKNEEALRRTERLNTVGELAAGVAHEIRNPLTTIKGFLSMIKSGQISDWYASIMLSELDRIEQIINEFLILSKPHLKNFAYKDVRTLLQEILPLFESQAIMKNIQLCKEFDSGELVIDCNEGQLKQVFINCMRNAIDALPNGGKVKITCCQEDDKVSIQFVDNGIGINEDVIEQIGKPFFTTKETGTGLGLMISFKIIEEHGGTYQIKSETGEGSSFIFRLPLIEAEKMKT